MIEKLELSAILQIMLKKCYFCKMVILVIFCKIECVKKWYFL